ncbi:glycosyltransferase family 4 protein [Bacillus sp. B190/17]|uniref:Glycosyltransferase family 4 protein n=1 Tax=Bacillus lumedeiriae TaxID=3058829 RepID=A0ABW8IDH8_9BACI
MKVLFITHRKPKVPGKGDQVRAFQQMKSLLKKGHIVHCLFQEKDEAYLCCAASMVNGDNTEKYKIKTKNNHWSAVKSFFLKGYPLSVSLHSFPVLEVFLKTLTHHFHYDVIHVQSKVLHNFANISISGSTVIVDYIDAISLNLERRYKWTRNLFEKWAVRGELRRMKKYEAFIKKQCSKAIIISPMDKKFLHSRRAKQTDVVPNYIDLSYFHMNQFVESRKKALVFTGTMSYAPNVDAAVRLVNDIYLPLKKTSPDLECWIVGTNPSAEVQKLNKMDGVTVTGFVEDIRHWQWRAAVYVCPLRFGAGQQNKILEASALGCPIVMSSVTNAGIGFTNNEEAIICEYNEEFIEQTERLLLNQQHAEILAKRARVFVASRFSEEIVADQLVAAYTSNERQYPKKSEAEE